MIGDDVAAALPEFRRQAESLMFDTCVVRRVSGETTDADGNVVSTYAPVYEGRCKITGDRPYEMQREAGGATFSVQRHIFHAPVDAGPFEEGHIVTITASRFQPHLVGNEYRIAGRDERSTQTSQRMYAEIT